MGSFSRSLLCFGRSVKALPRKAIVQPLVKRSFARCGKGFSLGKRCDLQGLENISVGNDVSFGPDTRIWTTGAEVIIGNDVMFGPHITLISGDHRTDVKDKPMRAVRPTEKLPSNDQDIVVGNDVWIGANVTILKGVHIPDGTVIAAGALVVRSPYEENCIWGGVPARLIGRRFDE